MRRGSGYDKQTFEVRSMLEKQPTKKKSTACLMHVLRYLSCVPKGKTDQDVLDLAEIVALKVEEEDGNAAQSNEWQLEASQLDDVQTRADQSGSRSSGDRSHNGQSDDCQSDSEASSGEPAGHQSEDSQSDDEHCKKLELTGGVRGEYVTKEDHLKSGGLSTFFVEAAPSINGGTHNQSRGYSDLEVNEIIGNALAKEEGVLKK